MEALLQSSAAATLAVTTAGSINMTSTASGYQAETANDANGNKLAIGTARTSTFSATGGCSRAATTVMDFWCGLVVGGSSAVAGDTALDLQQQYIGRAGITETVVLR